MRGVTDVSDSGGVAWPPGDCLEELLREARNGSEEALGQLGEACRRYLMLIARRELPEGLQAKLSASDVVQDTLIKAGQGFAGFEGHSRCELLGWLRAILLHSLADGCRRYEHAAKRDVNREVSLGDSQFARQEAVPLAADPSPSSCAMSREAREQLDRAIAALPENFRTVVSLHHRDSLAFHEIAMALGTTVDAVRKTWCRAIKQLGRQLDADDESR